MGYTKYNEDDAEINNDRMYFKGQKGKRLLTYYPEEMDDSVEKLEEIYEKNAKEKSVEITPSSRDDNTDQKTPSMVKNESKADVKKPKKYADRILYCKVCGKEFIFTQNDQIEYDKKGKCEPNRCAKCERLKNYPWLTNTF